MFFIDVSSINTLHCCQFCKTMMCYDSVLNAKPARSDFSAAVDVFKVDKRPFMILHSFCNIQCEYHLQPYIH